MLCLWAFVAPGDGLALGACVGAGRGTTGRTGRSVDQARPKENNVGVGVREIRRWGVGVCRVR